ncbi:hypothetical protein D3C72_2377060 [compost metagenome]
MAVDRLALKGAVQIDQMQPFEALAFEQAGLVGGFGVEDGRLAHLAAQQPNAGTVFEVDGGIDDHRGVSSYGVS